MSASRSALPRPLARLAVLATAATTAFAASVVLATGASAHVTVSSQDVAAGGYGKIVFRVPTESDTASTVGLRIQVPEEAAMVSLRTQPMPGWTVTRTSTDLAEPIEANGRRITNYVSVIEFRAEAGGIAPGEFQEFALSGGPFPEEEQLSFPSVQLYSDGSEAAWIEPSVDGQEPDRPAPVLDLAAARSPSGDGHGTVGSGGTAADDEPAEAADDDSWEGPALIVSILALLTAVGGVVLGWRANRRTVSS